MKNLFKKFAKPLVALPFFLFPHQEGSEPQDSELLLENKKKIVVLDAGHGYGNKHWWKMDWGGAFYKDETGKEFREADLTMSYAKSIAKKFDNKKYEILFTREDDIYPTPLQFRPYFAKEVNADFFVSLHINNINDYRRNELSGFEIFYSNKKSENFAKVLAKNLEELKIPRSVRGISKVKNFAVLKGTEMPSLLLELGYLTKREDRDWILNREEEISKAVSKSIEQMVDEDFIRTN